MENHAWLSGERGDPRSLTRPNCPSKCLAILLTFSLLNLGGRNIFFERGKKFIPVSTFKIKHSHIGNMTSKELKSEPAKDKQLTIYDYCSPIDYMPEGGGGAEDDTALGGDTKARREGT